jgi:hypothetical protein
VAHAAAKAITSTRFKRAPSGSSSCTKWEASVVVVVVNVVYVDIVTGLKDAPSTAHNKRVKLRERAQHDEIVGAHNSRCSVCRCASALQPAKSPETQCAAR